MDLLLGLDGGGSKTDLVFAGLTGPWAGPVRVAGTSLTRDSPAQVETVLRQGVAAVCTRLGCAASEFAAVCGGFSSAGDAGRERTYRQILHGLLPRAEIQIMTDAELTWRGATAGADGILVIAGTGSIAWGEYRGRKARAGGSGPGLDPGSADDLGRKAVAAGLVPPPADGNFARLLPTLVREHGREMDALFQQAGRDLAHLAIECAAQLQWVNPAVYTFGGTFNHAHAVLAYFKQYCPYRVLRPAMPPTAAAIDAARALLAHRP